MLKFLIKHKLAMFLSALRGQRNTHNYRCLMFHAVQSAQEAPCDLFAVSPEKLRAYLQYLKKENYHFVRFEEFSQSHDKAVSITFDDGYADNYTRALPIFEEYQVPFTVFVTSGFLNKESYLTSDQLIQLSKHPLVTIGAHGKHHQALPDLPESEITKELKESKADLEKLIGREVNTMSFPHGRYTQKIVDTALSLGYKKIGTSGPFANPDNWGNLVDRQCIFSCDNLCSFQQKINGLWDWIWKKSA